MELQDPIKDFESRKGEWFNIDKRAHLAVQLELPLLIPTSWDQLLEDNREFHPKKKRDHGIQKSPRRKKRT